MFWFCEFRQDGHKICDLRRNTQVISQKTGHKTQSETKTIRCPRQNFFSLHFSLAPTGFMSILMKSFDIASMVRVFSGCHLPWFDSGTLWLVFRMILQLRILRNYIKPLRNTNIIWDSFNDLLSISFALLVSAPVPTTISSFAYLGLPPRGKFLQISKLCLAFVHSPAANALRCYVICVTLREWNKIDTFSIPVKWLR